MDNSILVHCPRCNQDKPGTDFYRFKTGKLKRPCRECMKVENKARYTPKREPLIIPDGYKRCSRCNQHFPATIEYFYSNKSRPDGLNYLCRPCHQTYENSRIQQLPKGTLSRIFTCVRCGEEKPATVEYFSPSCLKRAGSRSTCRTCYTAARSEYYHAHPGDKERRREYERNLPEEKKEHKRAYVREWHRNNREYLNQHKRAYRKTEKVRLRRRVESRNAYARRMCASGKHTPQQVKEQYVRQKGKCYWCKTDLKKESRTPHIDHVTPLSRGGSNDIGNIVIACHHCNESRNNRLPHEWSKGGRLL